MVGVGGGAGGDTPAKEKGGKWERGSGMLSMGGTEASLIRSQRIGSNNANDIDIG